MFTFMAGATSTSECAARIVAVAASSAMPHAIFAITFAVAGTTSTRSAKSAASTCGMAVSRMP